MDLTFGFVNKRSGSLRWSGVSRIHFKQQQKTLRAKMISDRSNFRKRPQCERGLFRSTTGERKHEKSVCSSTESEMTGRSRETSAFLTRGLVLSVLQPKKRSFIRYFLPGRRKLHITFNRVIQL